MNTETIQRKNDAIIDELEVAMLENFPTIDCPLEHLFTPGIYMRSIFMPKDMWVTSLIHNTCHPYIVSQGIVSVYVDGKEAIKIIAPYAGITYPGTRRVLRTWENTIWSTIHPIPFITGEENEWSDEQKTELIAKIDSYIIEQHENKLLGGVLKNNVITKTIENESVI